MEIPKDVFFKTWNFYFAKWKMINDEILKLEQEGKLTTEELDKLFARIQAFNSLEEILDWA